MSACTDNIATDRTKKAPWLDRKQAHLAKLPSASPEAALVTAADQLHNIVDGLKTDPSRFAFLIDPCEPTQFDRSYSPAVPFD